MENLNWLDFVILGIILFYALEGYALGFIDAFLDLVSFVLSFAVGLKAYSFLGTLLVQYFALPIGISNALGFFVSALVSEIVIGVVLSRVIIRLPILPKFYLNLPFATLINRGLGILFGMSSGTILLAFLLTLIISLPTSAFFKQSVFSSRLGGIFVQRTQGFEKTINKVFGGALNETLNFLTIEPKSNETVGLNFTVGTFIIDTTAENEMLNLVNREREARGFAILVSDTKLKEVARNHCKDMFKRGYFSHYTPEGLSPFDRMDAANISYRFAGENLALSPNVSLAMQGLMNRPGHKANVLSTDFGRVGMGVIDGGIYGEMFCQEFTD